MFFVKCHNPSPMFSFYPGDKGEPVPQERYNLNKFKAMSYLIKISIIYRSNPPKMSEILELLLPK